MIYRFYAQLRFGGVVEVSMIIPSNCGDLKDILFQLGEQKGSLRGLLNFWSRRPRGATKKVRALPAT